MRKPGVLIIGGGATGLSAAIVSARMGAAVTLLEAGPRVGSKILASGNGRCNLTNLSISPSAYNHADFVGPVLGEASCDEIRSFFAGIGLLTSADDEGRVYPVTNFAGSVLDVLRLECEHLGVDVRCEFQAVHISQTSGSAGFDIASRDGEIVHAESIVVTTGGGGSLLADVGHALIEGAPVLGPIRTELEPIRGLSGVRVKCAATLLGGADADNAGGAPIATERGELLFRDYGVSGIMIFDLSRFLEGGCVLSIDFFPDITSTELEGMLIQRCASLSWRSAETFFAGMLHDRVARAVIRAAQMDVTDPVESAHLARLAALLKDFRLDVIGMGDERQAQVTRGGASVADFDPATLESRLVGGLFAGGEVLDIDGRSGGYNLHWAWASGIVAGESASRFAAARQAEHNTDSSGLE